MNKRGDANGTNMRQLSYTLLKMKWHNHEGYRGLSILGRPIALDCGFQNSYFSPVKCVWKFVHSTGRVIFTIGFPFTDILTL
jgi:hypothetical protein